MTAIAHVRTNQDGSMSKHDLSGSAGHLEGTAQLAGEFASAFNSKEWGELAGIWHDLGKFKPDFQDYIRAVTGYEREEAEEVGPGKVDHTAAGAIYATERQKDIGKVLAYLIAGHHSGMPDWSKVPTTPGRCLEERLGEKWHLQDALKGKIPTDLLQRPLPLKTPKCTEESMHLWIRMLFSCLVDADFLDTEAFMNPDQRLARYPGVNLGDLRKRYDQYMVQFQGIASNTSVNSLRQTILAECRRGAELEPGFFSLSVPTGGGKTLASMGFALDHALLYGKSRIIVAIPFTSIIEQTAETLRKIFGPDAILEHHSNLDPERESVQARLATENWDAPIVVTTNVQLFESLFAARTSACRKIHNIVNSVIILDEAQVLPPEYLKPILLGALKPLVEIFHVSVVLCTATQPALTGHIGPRIGQHGAGGFEGIDSKSVRELMSNPKELAERMRRTHVQTLTTPLESVSWGIIAESLATHEQVLCIVNTRKECRELHALMPPDTIHLSALMCGEHRSKVIAEIKGRLKINQPIRVVSTQLVEAGVDLDFPVVYRAMAGMDSIAQAAGRCNREGLLRDQNGAQKLGAVFVFQPEKPAPIGLLRFGEDAGKEMLRNHPKLVEQLSYELFEKYFRCYFDKAHGFDTKNIKGLLFDNASSGQFQFRTAAKEFRMIDDRAQKSILVWYSVEKEGMKLESRKLIETLESIGPNRKLMRQLQRFTVNVPEQQWKLLAEQGHIQAIQGPKGNLDLWAQCVPNLYDDRFGLHLDGPEYHGDEYIY